MSKIKILLNGHVDRQAVIDAIAADGVYMVEVVDNYVSGGGTVYNLDIESLGSTRKEAFLKILDNATELIELGAFVWKIAKDGKTFNLENAYVRDRLSTETPLTDLDDGTPLKLRIEIPGFLTNAYREIDLWYNQDFDPAEVDLMSQIGVTLTGNGAEFTIDNTVECKVSFSKPVSATEIYVIDFDLSNEIISV